MTTQPIDLWDPKTYDQEITDFLSRAETTVRHYYEEEARLDSLPEQPHLPVSSPRNEYATLKLELRMQLSEILAKKTARTYHYSRLTDREVEIIRASGMALSTLTALAERCKALVADGEISSDDADLITSTSPLNGIEYGERVGRIWSVSGPCPIDHHTVTPLLSSWGGEAARWCLGDNNDLLNRLRSIGTPRVIEISTDLAHANQGSAGSVVSGDVLNGLANRLGYSETIQYGDIFVEAPIGAQQILKIHSEGDESFNYLGV